MSPQGEGALLHGVEQATVELGGQSRRVAQPRSEDELRGLLTHLKEAKRRGEGQPVAFLGRGSSMEWCCPSLWNGAEPDRALWISMESLVESGGTGIIEYVPGDGTLTAQAGARMETLRAAVHEGGHRITPAGSAHGQSEGGTLGGLLASGGSSIDRCRFGPTRHHVLGMRVQEATDRGPIKTGGRLVKNVTGFDLHRLHVGGRGTLGAILEASLRLVPVPEAEVLVISKPFASTAEATVAALEVRAQPGIQPRALFVARRVVHVLLAGRERQVEEELSRTTAGLDADSVERGPHVEGQALKAAHRRSVVTIATAPSKVKGVVQGLEAAGIGPLYVEPDAALVEFDEEALSSVNADQIAAAHGGLDPRHAFVTLLRAAPPINGLRSALAERQSPPAAVRVWTERLRSNCDPDGILESADFPLRGASNP